MDAWPRPYMWRMHGAFETGSEVSGTQQSTSLEALLAPGESAPAARRVSTSGDLTSMDAKVDGVRRASWSRARSVAQPGLGLELRLVVDLLRVLPEPGAAFRVLVLPSNVLVDADGVVMVGVARPGSELAGQRYLAPEVRAGGDPNVASAIYSIGAMLFEAVTGSTFESPEQLNRQVKSSRVVAQAAGLGATFWEVGLLAAAQTATQAQPQQRFPSARAFADELERMARERMVARAELGEFVARLLTNSGSGRGRRASTSRPARALMGAEAGSTSSRSVPAVALPSVGGFGELEPPTTPMSRPELASFGDSEVPTTPIAKPPHLSPVVSAPVHKTLRGVGVMGDSLRASETAGLGNRKQTLIGVGSVADPAASSSAVEQPVAQRADKRVVGIKTPRLGSIESEEPPGIGSAVTAYPVKRSRTSRYLVASLLVATILALPVAYSTGALSASWLPDLRGGAAASDPRERAGEEKAARAAKAKQAEHASAVGSANDPPSLGSVRVRPVEAATDAGVAADATSEHPAGAEAESQAAGPTARPSKPVDAPPHRARKRRSRLPVSRDYGI